MFSPSKLAVRSAVTPPGLRWSPRNRPRHESTALQVNSHCHLTPSHTHTTSRLCRTCSGGACVFQAFSMHAQQGANGSDRLNFFLPFLAPILWQLLPHTQPRAIAIPITYVRHYSPPTKKAQSRQRHQFYAGRFGEKVRGFVSALFEYSESPSLLGLARPTRIARYPCIQARVGLWLAPLRCSVVAVLARRLYFHSRQFGQ